MCAWSVFFYCYRPRRLILESFSRSHVKNGHVLQKRKLALTVATYYSNNLLVDIAGISKKNDLKLGRLEYATPHSSYDDRGGNILISMSGEYRNTYRALQEISQLPYVIRWADVSIDSSSHHHVKTDLNVKFEK